VNFTELNPIKQKSSQLITLKCRDLNHSLELPPGANHGAYCYSSAGVTPTYAAQLTLTQRLLTKMALIIGPPSCYRLVSKKIPITLLTVFSPLNLIAGLPTSFIIN